MSDTAWRGELIPACMGEDPWLVEAGRIGDAGPEVVRDRIVRFDAQGAAGLINGRAPGPRPKLTDEHRRGLAEMVLILRCTAWCAGG